MSLYSDLLQKPYLGLAKPSVNVLAFTAANAEVQSIATDTTVAGIDSGSLRMRNVYKAVGAGPVIWMEGTNLSSNVKTVGKIEARFDNATNAVEHTNIGFTVLSTGAALTMRFSGQYSALHPTAAAGIALGTAALPFSQVAVGNAGLTRSAIVTAAGPGGFAGMVYDTNGGEHYVNVTRVLALTSTSVVVGPAVTGFSGANASLIVGLLSSGADAYGVVSGPVGTGKTNLWMFVAGSDIGSGGNRTVVNEFGGATTSSGATATTHAIFNTGTPAWTATNRYGFYGQLTAGANRYNIYCSGNAINYLAGLTAIGDVAGAYAHVFEVATAINGNAVARFRSTHVTPAADVLSLRGDSSSGYYLLRTQNNSTATDKFAIRGDGLIFIGNTVTQTDSALVNVAGRVSLTINQTHDLNATVLAATLIATTAITVADTKQNDIIRLVPTDVQLSGTGVMNGITISLPATVSSAASNARALNVVVSNSGAGTSYGALVRTLAGVGHTGTQYGLNIATTAQATTANSIGVAIDHSGRLSWAILIRGSTPGDQLDYGLYIDSSNNIVGSAVTYIQRAGSTGDFLQYIDSGATVRFKVDASGDLTFAGNGRRIKGDLTSATNADRLLFQTTSANATSHIGVIPSGTGTIAALRCYNTSAADAAGYIAIGIASANAFINSTNNGSTTQPLRLQIDGTSAIEIPTNRDVVLGPSGAVTTMAAGFPYMPAVAGTPTGVPTARAGYVPYVYDSTNNFLYVYNGGSWKKNTVFA